MTQPSPADASAALIASYQAQTQQLRDRLTAYLEAVWDAIRYHGQPEMTAFAQQVTPIVQAAQTQMSALTVGYLGAHRTMLLGRSIPVRVNPQTVTGAAARNGVNPTIVYERPFHEVWRVMHDLPKGPQSVAQAVEAGKRNAVTSGITDLQLTKVQTAQKAMTSDRKIVGYRRVLEGPHSCGLCIVASTRRYHKADLLPIHPACDCGVDPIYNGLNTSFVPDQERLAAVHEAIAERFGATSSAAKNIPGQFVDGKPIAYRDVLVTHDHGELGPVLGVRGQHFEHVQPATG